MKAASFEIILFCLELIINLNFVSEGHLQYYLGRFSHLNCLYNG